jgi:hypothetical protein
MNQYVALRWRSGIPGSPFVLRIAMEPKLFRAAEDATARGQRDTAYQLLCQVLLAHPTFVPAWVSMSKVVTDFGQQRDCLARALALDPGNEVARERLEQLRVKELLSGISILNPSATRSSARKLGDFLVAERVITAAQLHAALAAQSVRKRAGEQILLGELLLQIGLVTPESLARALVNQTLEWIPAHQQGIQSEAHVVERLGDYLVAEKIITPEQLEAALVEQLRLRQQGKHDLLGQILIRDGRLRIGTLEQILSRQRTEFYSKLGD